MQGVALMSRVVGYFKALRILAQASATLLLGDSMPGNVAHPPFAMNVSCFHESVALSSAKVAVAAAACWKLLTQIGASADTTAFLALCSAIFVAVFPSVHPPQPKPMITVARKPAMAPCKRRVNDSPWKILGNCMTSPSAREISGRG